MSDKCCICFPLGLGVKLLFVLTALDTLFFYYQAYMFPDYKELFLPFGVSFTILCLVWAMALINPTESMRINLFLAFLIFGFIFTEGYHAYLLVNGKPQEWQCREDALEQSMSHDDCVKKYPPLFWAEYPIGFVAMAYFTFVIMKWSKESDSYSKMS